MNQNVINLEHYSNLYNQLEILRDIERKTKQFMKKYDFYSDLLEFFLIRRVNTLISFYKFRFFTSVSIDNTMVNEYQLIDSQFEMYKKFVKNNILEIDNLKFYVGENFEDFIIFLKLMEDFFVQDYYSIEDLDEDIYSSEGSYLKNFKDKNFDIVLDIGQNIGLFSILMQKKYNSFIYQFEPLEDNRKILEKNIELNNLENQIKIIPIQLGDKEEVKSIYYNRKGIEPEQTFDRNRLNSEIQSEQVQIKTLDNVVQEYQIKLKFINLIKIDTEGYEKNILLGQKNILKQYKPKLTVQQYHYDNDMEELERIILDCNSNYNIYKTKSKILQY